MESAKIKPCPECGGRCVKVSVSIPHGGYVDAYLKLKQEERSLSFVHRLKGDKRNESLAEGFACIHCGYTALFAIDPENLIPDE
jgi:hypothetical protein